MSKNIVTARKLSGNKEIQTIATLSSSIAHELKNYLAAINIYAELSEGKLGEIKKTVKSAGYLINNLQLQIKGMISKTPDTSDFKQYSIIKNIEEAYYPFKPGEKELITLDKSQDFEYLGNPT